MKSIKELRNEYYTRKLIKQIDTYRHSESSTHTVQLRKIEKIANKHDFNKEEVTAYIKKKCSNYYRLNRLFVKNNLCTDEQMKLNYLMYEAVEKENFEDLDRYLNLGANPNVEYHGRYLVLVEALKIEDPTKRYQFVKELLEHGASDTIAVNSLKNDSQTTLLLMEHGVSLYFSGISPCRSEVDIMSEIYNNPSYFLGISNNNIFLKSNKNIDLFKRAAYYGLLRARDIEKNRENRISDAYLEKVSKLTEEIQEKCCELKEKNNNSAKSLDLSNKSAELDSTINRLSDEISK